MIQFSTNFFSQVIRSNQNQWKMEVRGSIGLSWINEDVGFSEFVIEHEQLTMLLDRTKLLF